MGLEGASDEFVAEVAEAGETVLPEGDTIVGVSVHVPCDGGWKRYESRAEEEVSLLHWNTFHVKFAVLLVDPNATL